MGRGLASVSARGTWLSLLCGLALIVPLRSQAEAQECLEDSDCDQGFECDQPPSAGSSQDCPPGAACEPVPEPAPQVGECEPMELTCMTDADCPSGAKCEISQHNCDSTSPASDSGSGDSSGAAGGAAPAQDRALPPAQCEQATEGECVYTLTECTNDSQCEGTEVCTALGTTSRCSGGEPTPSAATPPSCVGDGCIEPKPAPEPERAPAPPEESCTTTTISYCFPPPVDCNGGKACAGGARCVELPEDVQDDAPAGWEGASALCLPEVWALALEGRIELEGGGSSASDSDSGGSSNESRNTNTKGQTADDNAEGDDGADDGCAVSAPGSRRARATWPVLGCALFALGYARRRSRAAGARG